MSNCDRARAHRRTEKGEHLKTSHVLRTRLTRSAQRKPTSRRGRRARRELFVSGFRRFPCDLGERGWPDAGFWPAFKDTLELRTRTLQNQVALVFSIPVCPSPREARSGQLRSNPRPRRSLREIGFSACVARNAARSRSSTRFSASQFPTHDPKLEHNHSQNRSAQSHYPAADVVQRWHD